MTSEKTVLARAKKVGITIGGGVLLVIGIIAIPYPGPGWLIVFAALGILAQEYAWARRVLQFSRRQYTRWTGWVKEQGWSIRVLMFSLTTLVVVTTLWLLNTYGMLADLADLQWSWLHSPLI